tara:strand:+ start:744 stop:1184 length:441 start_codon:yes stop_codon:yes gene_type:complete
MDIKLFFSGFFKLYFYWEYIVIISTLVAVINSLLGVFSKKSFQNFDLRITLFSLIFNYIFLIIGLFIFVSNALLLFWYYDNKLMIEQDNFLFYISPHLLNLIAVLILTIGWSLHKKSNISLKKFLRILGFYFLGLLILIGKFIWMN